MPTVALRHKRPDYVIEAPDVLEVTIEGDDCEPATVEPIQGVHLVEQDGEIDLGPELGRVRVAGLTLERAELMVRDYAQPLVPDGKVSLSVHQQNSKVFYIIIENGQDGEIMRVPLTAAETVPNGLASVNGIDLTNRHVWLSRAADTDQTTTVMPIDTAELMADPEAGGDFELNPGDRIFIGEEPSVWENFVHSVWQSWNDLVETFSIGD